jgi:hypothetical protein
VAGFNLPTCRAILLVVAAVAMLLFLLLLLFSDSESELAWEKSVESRKSPNETAICILRLLELCFPPLYR